MREIGGIISVYVREKVYEQVSEQLGVRDQVSGHVWMQVSNGVYDQLGARVYNQVENECLRSILYGKVDF
jgi:hypothetical protein